MALTYPWGSSWFAIAVTPYLWSVARLNPDIGVVAAMPWLVKLHIVNAFLVSHFSRLHDWFTFWWSRTPTCGGGLRWCAGIAGHPPAGIVRKELTMRPSLKGTPSQGLLGATLGSFFGFAAVALFGPTASRFQELMGLSPMAVGFLVAMPALSGSLLRIPFAAWVETTGGRKPFLVLLALSNIGMAGLTSVAVWSTPIG